MYQYRHTIWNQSRKKTLGEVTILMKGVVWLKDLEALTKRPRPKMINLNAKHPPKSKSSWHTSKLIKWNYYIYKRADFFSAFVPQYSAGKNPK